MKSKAKRKSRLPVLMVFVVCVFLAYPAWYLFVRPGRESSQNHRARKIPPPQHKTAVICQKFQITTPLAAKPIYVCLLGMPLDFSNFSLDKVDFIIDDVSVHFSGMLSVVCRKIGRRLLVSSG